MNVTVSLVGFVIVISGLVQPVRTLPLADAADTVTGLPAGYGPEPLDGSTEAVPLPDGLTFTVTLYTEAVKLAVNTTSPAGISKMNGFTALPAGSVPELSVIVQPAKIYPVAAAALTRIPAPSSYDPPAVPEIVPFTGGVIVNEYI